MQTSNRILDDLARVANGAVSTLAGVKGEIDAIVRQRIERWLVDADLVSRDEFEAVKAMAAEARAEQDRLAKRVQELETKLAKATPKKAPPRTRKPAAKAAPETAQKPARASRRKPGTKSG